MFPLLRALFVALNIITLLLQFAFSWRSTPPWAVNKKIATLEDNSCLQRQTIYTVIKLSLSQGLTPDTKTDTITVFNQVELSEMNDNSERGRKKTLILTIPLLAMCIWSCIYSSLVHLWGSPTGLSTYKKRREEVWWDVSVMIKIEGLHILYSAGMTRGPERKIEQTDIFFSKGHSCFIKMFKSGKEVVTLSKRCMFNSIKDSKLPNNYNVINTVQKQIGSL